jgi:hypothetical protein
VFDCVMKKRSMEKESLAVQMTEKVRPAVGRFVVEIDQDIESVSTARCFT